MNKFVLITGGNRGLGKAAVKKLVERGMTVTFTARDVKKGEAVAAELRAQVPEAKVDCVGLDMLDRGSIRALARTIAARPEPLDVLVNNAGLLVSEKTPVRTAEGVEVTFATNLLGPFYLTHLLLPCLERSASARIVNVASRMHMPDGGWGPPVSFDFDDLGPQAHYQPTVAYKNSKLAMMWFTYELARRLPPRRITANAVCPGFVPATAAEDTHGAMRFLMRTLMPLMPFAHSIDEATDTYAMACAAPELDGTSGKFFGESKAIESSAESHDEAKAKRLWRLCNEMLQLPDWP
jgi:NAD(P)-dependent dehydrogenase (short-subunit alcohol dehydrogenase family)